MIFVDTNYFLRFLLEDNPEQYTKAKELFLEGSKGKLDLIASIIVVFEIFWVFKSYYNKTRPEIIEILQNLFKMDFIQIENKDILYKCVELFSKTNLSLEDCYNLSFAKSKNIKEFKTFDAKLAREFKR